MDFTYVFAAIIALVVGILAQLVRLTLRRQWSRGSGGAALAGAVAANALLLLRWSHLLDWGWKFAVLDLSIIMAATIIGFGAIAPTALVRIVRK